MQQELKQLIDRLTPELLASLESAAADCAGRGQQAVELEHWLWQLVSDYSKSFAAIERSFSINRHIIRDQLESRLDRIRGGYEGIPSLSPALVTVMRDAWVVASLHNSQNKIRLPHVLLALINTESFMTDDSSITDELRKLSQESLQRMGEQDQVTARKADTQERVTAALDKYTRNLTDQAKNGGLDPVVGRQDEIRQVIDILSRRRQNNPILVGAPGVGKTAIVEGLAQSIVDGEVPENLAGVELRILDLSLLQAGASIKGEFEKRLQDVINEVQGAPVSVILFVDEAHTLIGSGGAAGQNDAANLLKPALARGELRTIAATTWAEYKKYFESDAALTRRFQVVKIQEPGESDAIAMVRGVVCSLAEHHGVRVLDAAVEAAVRLSIRYIPERQLPDKAVSLLDTACSRVALSARATPKKINRLNQRKHYLEQELEALKHEWLSSQHQPRIEVIEQELEEINDEFKNLQGNWDREKQLVARIEGLTLLMDQQYHPPRSEGKGDSPSHQQRLQLQNLMDELAQAQGEQPMVKPFVDDQAVAEVIESWTGIPVGNMVADETQRLLTIEDQLAERIIGQKMAINAVSETIRINRTGLGDKRRPLGVFLMCGPSGVGKTETALALADQLFGGEQNLTVINMTEFKEEHKVSMLLGAPAGYTGYGEGGILTEAVRRKPHSILLLDEMEKAHPGVQDIFYQIFDKGRITDSGGLEVDFRNTLIIMTSNVADLDICHFMENRQETPEIDEILPAIQNNLLKYFKPAFLGRTRVIPYLPLEDDEMTSICRIALKRLEKSLYERYQASFMIDEPVISQLVEWNSSHHTGARAIEQIIQQQLMPELAKKCLMRTSAGQSIKKVQVSASKQGLEIHVS